MVAFDELFAQNHKITELSNVFLYLIKDRSMCDTDIAFDVFSNYVEKVDMPEIVAPALHCTALTLALKTVPSTPLISSE